jgi:hypothetical protein
LGLDKNLVTNIPPFEPGFSGHTLINYYYFSNLAIADVGRMFELPLILLQFQAFPLMTTILFGLLTYELGLQLGKNKNVGRMFSFLSYFGSDVGFLTSLVLLKKLFVTNLQSIDRGTLLLTNMPRALSLVVFLSGFILLIEYLKSRKILQFFLSGIILAATVGFKIYTGILSGIVIGITALTNFAKTKNIKIIVLLIIIGIVAFLIYYPINYSAGGLFWAPFAWPRHYFASTALAQIQWHLKEDVYRAHNNIPHLVVLYIQYTLVFLVTIFGTRIIGLAAIKPESKDRKFIHYLIYFSTIVLILLGLLFLQKSGIYNTFNFFSVATLPLSLLTARLVSRISDKRLFLLVTLTIVTLTLPRPIADFWGPVKSVYAGGGYIISRAELDALNFIKNESPESSIVLVGPDNPRDYYSPYVEIFSERSTFLSNLFILESHNQPVAERKIVVENIFSSKDKNEFFSKLRQNGINLVYLKLPLNSEVNYTYETDEIFFKNDEVIVVKP